MKVDAHVRALVTVALLTCAPALAHQMPPMVPGGALTPQGALSFTPAIIVNVADPAYGAKGDGSTDDWAAIEKAEGMNASGICTATQPTIVVIPPTATNKYVISQAIRLCSYVTLQVASNATQILFKGDASGTDYTGASGTNVWPLTGALVSGYLVEGSSLPTYAVTGALVVGATSVTLTTAANAGNFIVGDMLAIETTSTFTVGSGTEPTTSRIAVVTSANASTGVVAFDPPVDYANASVQVRRLTNGVGSGGWPAIASSTVPAFATHDCGVVGGAWIASSAAPWNQPWMAAGGSLNCKFAPDFVSAGFGVGYGNSYQSDDLSVRREEISEVAAELAYHSNGSRLAVGMVEMTGAPATIIPPPWSLAFDEGSYGNTMQVGRVLEANPLRALIAATGTPAGETVTANVNLPAIQSATITSGGGGTGYGNALTGTMTWSGSNCLINPVLNVTSNSSGVITTINGVTTSGYCTALPSTTATTWTAGGGLSAGSGAEFTVSGTLSYQASYADSGADTLQTIATALASSFNGLSGFTAAGFTAVGNPTNGAGDVLVYNSSPGVYFYGSGASVGGILTYAVYHDEFRAMDAYNNTARIGSIVGAGLSGWAADIIDAGYSGTEPPTTGNDVAIASSTFAYQYGDTIVQGAGAAQNTIRDGWYHGPTFAAKSFDFANPIGSHNAYRLLRSDAPTAAPSCDAIDFSNTLDDIYSPLSEPLALSGSEFSPSRYCRHDRVTSDNVKAFNGIAMQGGQTTVNSTTSYFLSTANFAGLEQGMRVRAELIATKTGAAGAVTGNITFDGCALTFSVPSGADAATIVGQWDMSSQNAEQGQMQIVSDASGTATTTTTTCSGSVAWSSAGHLGTTINVTTSPDTFVVRRLTVTPAAPSYRSIN